MYKKTQKKSKLIAEKSVGKPNNSEIMSPKQNQKYLKN